MSNRVIGGFSMSSNYEVSIKKPLDARSLVPTYDALLLKSNWVTSANKPIAYNGMLVTVANTTDASKNGLYYLFDPNCTSSLKSPDITVEANWHKVAELSDIEDIDSIKAQISAISADYLTRGDKSELQSKDAELLAAINSNTARFSDVYTISQADAKFVTEAHVENIVSSSIAEPLSVIARLDALLAARDSDEISVDDTGALGIKQLSTDKLVQGKAILVLDGGDAIDEDAE